MSGKLVPAQCRHLLLESAGFPFENFVLVIGKETSLVGAKSTDIQGKFDSPFLQHLLNLGFGTQQVADVSEGNPTPVEQFVDVRGEQ